MLGLTFSSKLDWGSYIISITKTASKKNWSPYMEYCCHVWAGVRSCYSELLQKLQKWICRTVSPSLATSLEPLAHHRNVASLSLSMGIALVNVHLNWLNWFHSFTLKVGLLVILIDCMIFCHHP